MQQTITRQVPVSSLPRDERGTVRFVIPPGLEVEGISYNGIGFIVDFGWGLPFGGLGSKSYYLDEADLPTDGREHALTIWFEGVPDDRLAPQQVVQERQELSELVVNCLLVKEDRDAVEAELQEALSKFGPQRARFVYWSHVVRGTKKVSGTFFERIRKR